MVTFESTDVNETCGGVTWKSVMSIDRLPVISI